MLAPTIIAPGRERLYFPISKDVILYTPYPLVGGGAGEYEDGYTTLEDIAKSLGATFEYVSKNIKSLPGTITYNAGVIASIDYGDFIKTFNYTSGLLTSIVLDGAGFAPGMSLTKTLEYDVNNNLISWSYS